MAPPVLNLGADGVKVWHRRCQSIKPSAAGGAKLVFVDEPLPPTQLQPRKTVEDGASPPGPRCSQRPACPTPRRRMIEHGKSQLQTRQQAFSESLGEKDRRREGECWRASHLHAPIRPRACKPKPPANLAKDAGPPQFSSASFSKTAARLCRRARRPSRSPLHDLQPFAERIEHPVV